MRCGIYRIARLGTNLHDGRRVAWLLSKVQGCQPNVALRTTCLACNYVNPNLTSLLLLVQVNVPIPQTPLLPIMSGRQQRVMVQPIVSDSQILYHFFPFIPQQNVIFKNLQQVSIFCSIVNIPL